DRFMREHAARNEGRSGVDWSVANTVRDATHVRGGGMPGGLPGSGSNAVADHAANGHENYTKSFKKNR
ncbi:MAG: hypothetical protein P8N50_11095, partial [Actinomycetota bacterium]|nr:hypothetical protein [Actinomycetota bacterium]